MSSQQVKNVSQVINTIKNLNDVENLSEYGRDFQIKLLSLLIKDRIFCFSIIPILKNEYFSDIYLRKIYVTITNYIVQFGTCPTSDNIKILLKEAGEKITLYDKIIDNIEAASLEDRDFIMNKAHQFCFSKHALIEQQKVTKLLEQGKFEEAKAISIDSFKYSGGNTTKIYNLKEDYIKVFDEEREHNPVPTPFKTFNDNMKGGPGKGNLVIMVAESNFGKSNALIAMSRHANANKKNVVFFSFEIGGADMLRRHLAGLNNLRQEEVKNNRKAIEIRLKDDGLGDFILIEERATNARISVIKNHLEYLKSTGFFPDMICVDALNQLKLPIGMRYEGDNQKFEYLSEELRDMANEYEVPVYTVMQTNRSGFGSEINDIQAIGKAIEPFQVADVLITFAQTKPMASENKCRAFLAKNRLGKKFILLDVYYDPNMCVFDEIAVVDDLLLMSDKQREEVKNTALNMKARLQAGEFSGKK